MLSEEQALQKKEKEKNNNHKIKKDPITESAINAAKAKPPRQDEKGKKKKNLREEKTLKGG